VIENAEGNTETKENNMRRNIYWISLTLGILLAAAVATGARADSVSFTATPTDVSGPAGSTVGWGYTITNNSTTDYLDINSIDSDLYSATDGIPDASIFNFPNLAPGQTVTQAYDPVDGLGLFQFTWNAGVAVGTTESGLFGLYGAFCDASDPFCVDDGDVQGSDVAFASYSATVVPAAGVPTPEPGTLLLCGLGLIALGILQKRAGFLPALASLKSKKDHDLAAASS
jgi:PEP-CTERM motif